MFYRIRAIRSTIGMPKTIRETCMALGLKKRGNVVYRPVNPGVAGQILRIKELVNVQIVDEKVTREGERLIRRGPRGFTVESSS